MKIGKYEYDIVVGDKFLDNGVCVQLLTQSKETCRKWGRKPPNPILSKKAIKELHSKFTLKASPYGTTSAIGYTVVGEL